jgi:hypothetical protein
LGLGIGDAILRTSNIQRPTSNIILGIASVCGDGLDRPPPWPPPSQGGGAKHPPLAKGSQPACGLAGIIGGVNECTITHNLVL